MLGSDPTPRRAGEYAVPGIDPALIAQGVRQIAHDLHVLLRKTHTNPGELIELVERIDQLRLYTHGTRMLAIDRWLDSSQSAIRARVAAEQTSLKDVYATVRRRRDCLTAC